MRKIQLQPEPQQAMHINFIVDIGAGEGNRNVLSIQATTGEVLLSAPASAAGADSFRTR
jgi:hypothetical protein